MSSRAGRSDRYSAALPKGSGIDNEAKDSNTSISPPKRCDQSPRALRRTAYSPLLYDRSSRLDRSRECRDSR